MDDPEVPLESTEPIDSAAAAGWRVDDERINGIWDDVDSGVEGGRLERVPLDDPAAEAAWRASMETPSGRAYFAEGDPMRAFAEEVRPREEVYTIDIHGTRTGEFAAGGPEGPIELSVDQMAELIRADPNWDSRPIRLLSCWTGDPPFGAKPPAQQLADRLGVDVIAPHGKAWNDAAGRLFSSGSQLDAFGFLCPSGKQIPEHEWPTYQPRGVT